MSAGLRWAAGEICPRSSSAATFCASASSGAVHLTSNQAAMGPLQCCGVQQIPRSSSLSCVSLQSLLGCCGHLKMLHTPFTWFSGAAGAGGSMYVFVQGGERAERFWSS